jgi:hypothetical protein
MRVSSVVSLLRGFAAAVGVCLALAAAAAAQGLGKVSGSDVEAGENTLEYRFAFSPDNDGRPEAFAHRFHFQHGFNDALRGRVILFAGNKGGEPFKTTGVGVEALYQFIESEKSGSWDSAIRVEGAIATIDGRPDRIRVGWHNAVELSRSWELRTVFLMGKELGDNHSDGLTLETREELTAKLGSNLRLGVQAFNNFNTTAHIGSFDEQRHQVGPVMQAKLTDHLKLETSVLIGISDDPTDLDARVFLTYGF